MDSVISFAEMEHNDFINRPYEVWHPDGEGATPKFALWVEAIAAQKQWNVKCSGHIARKRKQPTDKRGQ